jgi:hypothetical protein
MFHQWASTPAASQNCIGDDHVTRVPKPPALTFDVSVQCFEHKQRPTWAHGAFDERTALPTEGLPSGPWDFEKPEFFQTKTKIVGWRNGK